MTRLVRVPVVAVMADRLRVGQQVALERDGVFVLALVVGVEASGPEVEVVLLHGGGKSVVRLQDGETLEVVG